MKRISKLHIALFAACLLAITACKPDNGGSESSAQAGDQETSTEASVESSAETSATAEGLDVQKVTGVVIDGAKSYIVIQDASGEQYNFEYPDLDYKHRDAYQIGDTMVVTYVPNPELGDSVVALRQSNPEKSRLNAMR